MEESGADKLLEGAPGEILENFSPTLSGECVEYVHNNRHLGMVYIRSKDSSEELL